MAAPKNSSTSLDNFMMACMQGCKTTEKAPKPFLSQIGLSSGVSWPPTLFSIMLSAKLFDVFSSSDNGIYIQYHTDSFFFKLRRLQAKNKEKINSINKFLFADNCALNATTKVNMQNIVDKFSMACDNFGLTISTDKTEVMYPPVSGEPYIEPNISI